MSASALSWAWCSPPQRGAIGIATVWGGPHEVDAFLASCCRTAPAVGASSRCEMADETGVFDDGVVARISDRCALLMPHGGVRIAQRTRRWLTNHGAREHHGDAITLFPEARSAAEANALAWMSRATSPRAIDVLAQFARFGATTDGCTAEALERSGRLHRLLTPPLVVLTGPSNVGKSTLTNSLAGHRVSVTHDSAGTTRDAVLTRLDLDGLVVDWIDAPGALASPSAIDERAAQLASVDAARADLVVEATAPGFGWIDPRVRAPGVRVLLQADRDGARSCSEHAQADAIVSAHTRSGVPELAILIRRAFVRDDDLIEGCCCLPALTNP